MDFIKTLAAGGLIVLGASAGYAQGKNGQQEKHGDKLIETLNSLANAANPPGQDKRPDDPDMGDDNASKKAILTVCTKDTPAAERSAICDGEPISPE